MRGGGIHSHSGSGLNERDWQHDFFEIENFEWCVRVVLPNVNGGDSRGLVFASFVLRENARTSVLNLKESTLEVAPMSI